MTRLRCVLALLVFGVTGCSPLFYMTVQNNSAAEVELCNLHRHDNACVSAAPQGHARVLLVADYGDRLRRFAFQAAQVQRPTILGTLTFRRWDQWTPVQCSIDAAVS